MFGWNSTLHAREELSATFFWTGFLQRKPPGKVSEVDSGREVAPREDRKREVSSPPYQPPLKVGPPDSPLYPKRNVNREEPKSGAESERLRRERHDDEEYLLYSYRSTQWTVLT